MTSPTPLCARYDAEKLQYYTEHYERVRWVVFGTFVKWCCVEPVQARPKDVPYASELTYHRNSYLWPRLTNCVLLGCVPTDNHRVVSLCEVILMVCCFLLQNKDIDRRGKNQPNQVEEKRSDKNTLYGGLSGVCHLYHVCLVILAYQEAGLHLPSPTVLLRFSYRKASKTSCMEANDAGECIMAHV